MQTAAKVPLENKQAVAHSVGVELLLVMLN